MLSCVRCCKRTRRRLPSTRSRASGSGASCRAIDTIADRYGSPSRPLAEGLRTWKCEPKCDLSSERRSHFGWTPGFGFPGDRRAELACFRRSDPAPRPRVHQIRRRPERREKLNATVLFRLVLVALAGVLAGCGGGVRYTSSYPPPPEHFSNHSVEQDGFFGLHWTLERKEAQVIISGIVTAEQVGGVVARATVEVAGVDQAGRTLSRARGVTYGGSFFRGQSRPFWIRLRPTGQETGFRVRVWSFEWEHGDGVDVMGTRAR